MHIHSLQSEFKTWTSFSNPELKITHIVWIRVKFCKQNFYICCLYRPPDTQIQYWSTLTSSLEGIEGNNIIVMGDLNVDTLSKNDKRYQHLHSFCLALQLQGIVKHPVRIATCSLKCLDFFLNKYWHKNSPNMSCTWTSQTMRLWRQF